MDWLEGALFVDLYRRNGELNAKMSDTMKWQDYMARGVSPETIIARETRLIERAYSEASSIYGALKIICKISIIMALLGIPVSLHNSGGIHVFLPDLSLYMALLGTPLSIVSLIILLFFRPLRRKTYCFVMAEKMLRSRNVK